MSETYFERLRASVRGRDSLLCVGLDPDPERIPGGAAGAARFCVEIVARTSDFAACYKPNSAFWEQYGPDGWDALAEVRASIPDSTPVLFDVKRADIGNTNAAYARAAFEAMKMDAVTVHAYHGADSLREFTAWSDRGVYVVCRTSNPGGADLQQLDAGGRPLYQRVAELAAAVNTAGNVGLVAGATSPDEIRALRAITDLPFLVPGVGAQNGELEASVLAAWTGDPASCLVNSSRAILYAADPGLEARNLRDRMRVLLAGVR